MKKKKMHAFLLISFYTTIKDINKKFAKKSQAFKTCIKPVLTKDHLPKRDFDMNLEYKEIE
jgi:hypothetical protein